MWGSGDDWDRRRNQIRIKSESKNNINKVIRNNSNFRLPRKNRNIVLKAHRDNMLSFMECV
jgi:hypothetical protein